MHNFKELKIWEKSRELVKQIYQVTKQFPSSEKFTLTSQIQRASISVGLNIVEGSGRGSDKDFSRFLDISYASLLEVEGCLIIACDLEFCTDTEINEISNIIEELKRMLISFNRNLK